MDTKITKTIGSDNYTETTTYTPIYNNDTTPTGNYNLAPLPQAWNKTTNLVKIQDNEQYRYSVKENNVSPYNVNYVTSALELINNRRTYIPINIYNQNEDMKISLIIQVAKLSNPKLSSSQLVDIKIQYKQDMNKAEHEYNYMALYKQYEWYIHPITTALVPDKWDLEGINK